MKAIQLAAVAALTVSLSACSTLAANKQHEAPPTHLGSAPAAPEKCPCVTFGQDKANFVGNVLVKLKGLSDQQVQAAQQDSNIYGTLINEMQAQLQGGVAPAKK